MHRPSSCAMLLLAWWTDVLMSSAGGRTVLLVVVLTQQQLAFRALTTGVSQSIRACQATVSEHKLQL